MDKFRVRFAPSPTGFLHVGGLRTALFNYLFSKKNNGQFLLRIEDTDRERLVEGSEEDIKRNLKLFGLNWHSDAIKQSERLSKYNEYAQKLISEDKAYYEQSEKGRAVRFKMKQEGITEFEDLVYGKLQFKNETFKDPIILKSDGYPVYNFANVIDDHEMQISHVIRGEEFLPSTPIHIQIYEALGWKAPEFVHLSLILDKDRKKLSKRTGDVAVKEYVEKGYLPQALLNFIALLGWNPKTEQEIFSLEELIKEFDVKKINKAGAIFDPDKLNFINSEWIKRLKLTAPEANPIFKPTISSVLGHLGPQAPAASDTEATTKIVFPQILERLSGPNRLDEETKEFLFYYKEPEYETRLLIWKDTPKDKIKKNLEMLLDLISKESQVSNLQSKVLNYLEERGIGKGEALWPLRVALTGLQNSPGPFEIIDVFSKLPKGREKVLDRIKKAIEKLTKL